MWKGDKCSDDLDATSGTSNGGSAALLQAKVTPSSGWSAPNEESTLLFTVAGNQLGVGESNIKLCLDVLSVGIEGAPFAAGSSLRKDVDFWADGHHGWLGHGSVSVTSDLNITATVEEFSGLLPLPQKLPQFTLASESRTMQYQILLYWVAKDTSMRWTATVDDTYSPNLPIVPKEKRNKKVRAWLSLSRTTADAKSTGDFAEVRIELTL